MPKDFIRTTESTSLYNNIEKSSTLDILQNINTEDKKVAIEVEKQIPQIQLFVDAAAEKLVNGGRLFYIGAGTSGRLGLVLGIAASGTTPYVIGGLQKCKEVGIQTGSISCNKNSPVSAVAHFPIEVVVGPEFLTGSTRMKSGTAQKMVLNMISTTIMIKLGRIEGNKMVHMQLTNQKLFDRGAKMIMEELDLSDINIANALLREHGSVKKSIDNYKL